MRITLKFSLFYTLSTELEPSTIVSKLSLTSYFLLHPKLPLPSSFLIWGVWERLFVGLPLFPLPFRQPSTHCWSRLIILKCKADHVILPLILQWLPIVFRLKSEVLARHRGFHDLVLACFSFLVAFSSPANSSWGPWKSELPIFGPLGHHIVYFSIKISIHCLHLYKDATFFSYTFHLHTHFFFLVRMNIFYSYPSLKIPLWSENVSKLPDTLEISSSVLVLSFGFHNILYSPLTWLLIIIL